MENLRLVLDRALCLWLTGCVAMVSMVAPAVADDLFPPDWRGEPNTTFQHWTFDTNQNPNQDGSPWFPEVHDNPYGEPLITTYYGDENWYDLWEGREGVMEPWDNDLYINLPNVPDTDDLKIVWVQMTWWSDYGFDPPVFYESDPYGVLFFEEHHELDAGWWHSVYKIWIPGNPEFEVVSFMTDQYLDQIVVDTICILTLGACCVNGDCVATNTEPECEALEGDWYIYEDCSTFNCPVPPPNDDCANAIYITDVVDLPFDTTEATFDGDGWCMESPNIWYCYTADSTGQALFSLCGSEYDTALAVYDGCWCYDSEMMLDCNDDDYCDGEWTYQSSLVIDVVEGNEYLIEVGGYYQHTGAGVLTVEAPWYPPNDFCEDGIPIGDGFYHFSNHWATTDGPSEDGECSVLEDDIWFIYDAEASGQVMVSLRGTGSHGMAFDTVIAVYEGDCPTSPGSLIACNNDACRSQSELIFNAEEGMSYPIRIGGAYGAQGSALMLIYHIRELAGCPADLTWDGVVDIDDLFAVLASWGPCGECLEDLNYDGLVDIDDLFLILANWGDCPPVGFDDCDSPAPVQDGAYWFDTSDATTAADPVWDCGWDVGHDIWVCYQASGTGVAQFSLTFSEFDTVLQVYEGCGDEMWLIGCNSDYCDGASGLTMDVMEGSLYKLRIGGNGQAAGFGRLSVQGFGYSSPYYCSNPYDPPFVYGHDGPFFCGANLFGEQSRFIAAGSMIAVVSLVGIQLTASKRRQSDPAAAQSEPQSARTPDSPNP